MPYLTLDASGNADVKIPVEGGNRYLFWFILPDGALLVSGSGEPYEQTSDEGGNQEELGFAIDVLNSADVIYDLTAITYGRFEFPAATSKFGFRVIGGNAANNTALIKYGLIRISR